MSADTTITCRDCGQAFTFTSGEQDFYASRGFSEPSRCADCRAARKAQRDGGGSSYRSYGSSSSYGGGERSQREMFSATCSSCGQEAQVPFQPSGDKPATKWRVGSSVGGRHSACRAAPRLTPRAKTRRLRPVLAGWRRSTTLVLWSRWCTIYGNCATRRTATPATNPRLMRCGHTVEHHAS